MKNKNYLALSLLLCAQLTVHVSFAQLTVKPLQNPVKGINQYSARQSETNEIQLTLPFFDDFSYTGSAPDSNLWIKGSSVLINQGLALHPPTFNVASFDGSFADGSPHNPDGTTIENTDTLTSQAIDLSGLKGTDNVYLSFYWQMKGLGNQPQKGDNIKLEFLGNDGVQWDSVWSVKGDPDNVKDGFTYKAININISKYFYDHFQFRFVSAGGTTGPFDIWNIDYVYLNKNRTGNEPIEDQSIRYMSNSLFKSYLQMPYSQLLALPANQLIDYSFKMKNFDNQIIDISADYNLRNADTDENLYNFQITNRTLNYDDDLVEDVPIPMFNQNVIDNLDKNADHISLKSELILHTSNLDVFKNNDHMTTTFDFNEMLAYDDGSAELSAGLNKSEGKIAVKYNLFTSDIMTHIDICFPIAGRDPSVHRFNLGIALDLNEPTKILRETEFLLDYSEYTINKFSRFEFTKPLLLQGTFYVVIQTFTNDYVPIGLDMNTNSSDNIFVNLDGNWLRDDVKQELIPASYLKGSLMIRPGFGDKEDVVSGNTDQLSFTNSIYPNPVNNQLHISGKFEEYTLIDLSGKTIIKGNEQTFDTSQLPNGLYVLKIYTGSLKIEHHKVLIRH